MNNYVVILIISVFVASCSQILLKLSASEEHEVFWKEYVNLKVMLGYGMMVCSTVLTILALRGMDYKKEAIIESVGYLFVMILGRIFLKEKITRKKLIGNFLILFGILVFHMGT